MPEADLRALYAISRKVLGLPYIQKMLEYTFILPYCSTCLRKEVTKGEHSVQCWEIRRYKLETKCLLVALQRPKVHLLRLRQLALVLVEVAELVDR